MKCGLCCIVVNRARDSTYFHPAPANQLRVPHVPDLLLVWINGI